MCLCVHGGDILWGSFSLSTVWDTGQQASALAASAFTVDPVRRLSKHLTDAIMASVSLYKFICPLPKGSSVKATQLPVLSLDFTSRLNNEANTRRGSQLHMSSLKE